MSNRDEYVAGTLPFDPEDGFFLTLGQFDQDVSGLEFLAIRGRTYTLWMSTD
jgi:hypothetical protein